MAEAARPVRVEVVGEVVVDLVAGSDGRLTPVPGGSPANVALALARQDVPVALRARFGTDALARRCREHLGANGVDLALAVAATQPATLALATVGDDGSAAYDFWVTGTADWQWSDAELADCPAPGTAALHTGSLASWLAPGRDVLLGLVRRARAADEVTVSYDPNVRAALMGEPARARQVVEAYVAASHVVKASDEDVAWLYDDADASTVRTRWHSLGARLVVITSGGEGLRASTSTGLDVAVAAPRVDVVDTVGAGDTVSGALLASLGDHGALGDRPAARLDALDAASLREVLQWAAASAAITCSREGAQPPSRAEVSALLAG